ncbi:hypothetical protein CW745_13965 [Psychromonas sp. psych-6C06]|uniref:antiterminator Q family protein n=1 Tax=Psychromonas sp. psych-6C06 TaxID=2058089 RepID=UPI000C334BBF|nr:antiterminator Q family protein [Psychromonas sp. psych-6C06]PKF60632.1 hypothetical protein CW745_13965 [Psychromonas sp. psych-6C06]
MSLNSNTCWLLSQWSIWARVGRAVPNGYGESPMFKEVAAKITKPNIMITDDEAMQIDAILAKLNVRDAEMAKAVVTYHFSNGNASHVARVLSYDAKKKINRKRADVLVKAGTAWVDACLFMNEVA